MTSWLPASNAIRAVVITVFTIALIITLAALSRGPVSDQHKSESIVDKSRNLGNSLETRRAEGVVRRDLPELNATGSLPFDDPTVLLGEALLRSWLNSHRSKKCSDLPVYTEQGKVHFGTTEAGADGRQQYLLEVAYGNEIFLARLWQIVTSSNPTAHPLRVAEVVPDACARAAKDKLAVTSKGNFTHSSACNCAGSLSCLLLSSG